MPSSTQQPTVPADRAVRLIGELLADLPPFQSLHIDAKAPNRINIQVETPGHVSRYGGAFGTGPMGLTQADGGVICHVTGDWHGWLIDVSTPKMATGSAS